MFLFCSIGVNRADGAGCGFPLRPQSAAQASCRPTAEEGERERKHYPALKSNSQGVESWVVSSRRDPWC